MSNTRKNVIANYFGAGWSAMLSFLTIPFLLSMLGAEAYGLIALFLAIKAIASVFDFGLAVATNREVAFRLGCKDSPIGSLITTVEVLYWIIGIIISFIVWGVLQLFLVDWVSTEVLRSDQLVIMSLFFAISLGISFPVVLYQNLLRSFNKHIAYNIALVLSATFKNPGALLLLWMFSSSIEVFMNWYLITSVVEIIMYWMLVKGKIALVSDCSSGRFNYSSLSGMKKFAVGTGVSSIIAAVIFQIDKVLISKFLNLELLGYYSAILALVGAFGKLTTPIVTAVFPRLATTYGAGDVKSVANMYQYYTQTINRLLVPIVVALIAFAPQILELWLPSAVENSDLYYVVIFLGIAYMFYSLANMPIITLMAFKNINILIVFRTIALVLLVPVLLFLIINYGLKGAAIGVLSCSIFLYMALVISVSRKIFIHYKINEISMLVIPLLVSVPIFYLLQSALVIWSDNNFSWLLLAIVGTIVSYIIIFHSYFLSRKARNRSV